MRSPLTHVGQTARPEHAPQQQQQDQQGSGPQGQDAQPLNAPGVQPGAAQHEQRQSEFSKRITELHEERDRQQQQQRQADAEDPASDANTESANHPNDE